MSDTTPESDVTESTEASAGPARKPAPQAPLSEEEYATLDDFETMRQVRTKDVYLSEIGKWVKIRGLSFGLQMKIREEASMRVDQKGNRVEDTGRLRVLTILHCVVKPKLGLEQYEAILEASPGSIMELMHEIEVLSGMTEIQQIERAIKLLRAIEDGNLAEAERLAQVNFSKPPPAG